jgi:hypothetical protein
MWTESAHDFGSGLATARVGRVSPRPQDRGCNCIRLGREPLREAKVSDLTGRWVAGEPAVSERRALSSTGRTTVAMLCVPYQANLPNATDPATT